MTDTVRDAIAASLLLETRIVADPVEPFGYGSDVSCEADVDAGVAEIPGSDPLVLAQALVRRLDTPRGSLPDDAGYGISLRSYLSAGTTTTELQRLAGVIRNELVKDDRVESLSVTVTPSTTGDTLAVLLSITPADVGISFTMTLAVSSGAVLLEAIS